MFLYFHGSGGRDPNGNPWFHNIEEAVGGRHMPMLKMIFTGDGTDWGNELHMDATKYAIAKMMATYKIIPGRGLAAAFSAGGEPLSALVNEAGGWPFCHVLSESGVYTNVVSNAASSKRQSWTFAIGQTEYGSWDLGPLAVDNVTALVDGFDSGVPQDIHFQVLANAGHDTQYHEDTIATAMAAYDRSVVLRSPFVYRADFSATELAPAVDSAEALHYGRMYELVESLRAAGVSPLANAQLQQLATLLERRVGAIVELLADLAETDPVLAHAEASRLVERFGGHPRQGEIEQVVADIESGASFDVAQSQTMQWYDAFDSFLTLEGEVVQLADDAPTNVMEIANDIPSTALVGRMAAEFLALGARARPRRWERHP